MKWKTCFLLLALGLLGSSQVWAQEPTDPPVTYTVTVVDSIVGSSLHGGGTVTGAGSYASGATATLNVTAVEEGYSFVGWSDGNNDNPREVTVVSDTTLYAMFFKSGITILGSVFGAGEGTTATVGVNSSVYMYDGLVETNVYGGGQLAQVTGNTTVEISGGEVGVVEYTSTGVTHTHGNLTDGGFGGHVFGGGKGSDTDVNDGRVLGNATVAISGGHVQFSVYGGGEMGSVGQSTITYATANDPTSPVVSIAPVTNTGLATVTVTGGQVGPAPTNEISIALNGNDGYVFGGGKGKGDDPLNQYIRYADVNNTSVTINIPANADITENRIWGSVFGGAEDGHVLGNANVYYQSGLTGTTGTTSYDGNIFGGGRNYSRKNYTAGRVQGNVNIEMTNGQIYGSIFGAGRQSMTGCGVNGFYLRADGRYGAMLDGDDHGKVTISVQGGTVGNPALIASFTEYSMGDVFGGGKGYIGGIAVPGHPAESPLLLSLCKNTDVTITGTARILGSVFGGGEVGNVGNYTWEMPDATTIQNIGITSDGFAKVTVSGNAIIGIDDMFMDSEIADGENNFNLKKNFDLGHVFGGGEGLVIDPATTPVINAGDQGHNNVRLIDLMATVDTTSVTINGSAFVKGSVYGGGENGHVLGGTYVGIAGGQVGCGEGTNDRYADNQFIDPTNTTVTTANALAICPSWEYDPQTNYPYDPVRIKNNNEAPTNGRTFFGNVFGGGSGYYPYVKLNTNTNQYESHWNPNSGIVEGTTKVEITGGHILSSVYGGCEQGSVGTYSVTDGVVTNPTHGAATVIMSNGTVGVPRTDQQILDHPFTGYLYGAGKGDPRNVFDTLTNVSSTTVALSGGKVYGAVFGGGEDGHVTGNVNFTISNNVIIGTSGLTSVDGNVFGGGRGLNGTSPVAGAVGGNVVLNIQGGTMLGSIYGGGRLASVGTHIASEKLDNGNDNPNYGIMQDGKGHGMVNINISNGTIGKELALTNTAHTTNGNVYGGSRGGFDLLDNTTNPIWPDLAEVKQTELTISNNALVYGNVYGGGEMGTVLDSAIVKVTGGTIVNDLYGGGYGSDNLTKKAAFIDPNITNATSVQVTPMQLAGRVGKNTLIKIEGGWIKRHVYGGGEMASVGTITDSIQHASGSSYAFSWPYQFKYLDETGTTNIDITGGRIGKNGKDYLPNDVEVDNGDVYGGSKGLVRERYVEALGANVNKTVVKVNYTNLNVNSSNYIDAANINAEHGCIAGALYGGGENGHVNDSTSIRITKGLIGHAVYGGGKGKDKYNDKYSLTAGKVYGNTHITINPANNTDVYVVRSIFGGGNLASVGKGNYSGFGEVSDQNVNWADSTNTGHTYINIKGGTIGKLDPVAANVFKDNIPYGSVFGGCRGKAVDGNNDMIMNPTQYPNYIAEHPEIFVGTVNNTHIAIGTAGSSNGPHIYGSVYGGAQDGQVRYNTNVLVNSGEIGLDYNTADAVANVGTTDITHQQWTERGNVYGGGAGLGTYKEGGVDKYNNFSGYVIGFDTVTINGGTIHRNVYGGGNLSSVGPPLHVNKRVSNSVVNINSNIGENTTSGYGGYVYGSSRGKPSTAAKEFEHFSVCSNTEVNIGKAAGSNPIIPNVVYGGGENGQVRDTAVVNLYAGQVIHSIYGGGEGNWGQTGTYASDTISGRVRGTTYVNLLGGQVGNSGDNGNVFGGCRSSFVLGDVYVNVGKEDPNDTNSYIGDVTITGDVFGANNEHGSPLGNINVNIYSTHHTANDLATGGTGFAIRSVFGGGNEASYTPKAPTRTDSGKSTTVHVWSCNNTIQDLFGGANAADIGTETVNTNSNVIVDGGRFDRVFGGGNGNPTAANIYGTASTSVYGGTIRQLFGGSNQVGSIVETNLQLEDSRSDCTTDIVEIYGGSNEGDIAGDVNTTINCGTGEYDELYGGALNANIGGNVTLNVYGNTITNLYGGSKGLSQAANIGGNVNLNIYGGTIVNAFGGSNLQGNVGGDITVTVDDQSEQCPLNLNYVYGGGQVATCSGNATVNLVNGTVNNNVYGGGMGLITDADAARVSGNTHVDMGGNFLVRGNIYGGGRNASVGDGDLTNQIGTAKVTISGGTVGVEAAGQALTTGNVYGGGFGQAGTAYSNLGNVDSTYVEISGNAYIVNSVFGGSESGHVLGNTNVLVDGGTIGKPLTLAERTIDAEGQGQRIMTGNVYGGGSGSTLTDPTDPTSYSPTEGRVYGNTKVTVSNGTVRHAVYGGGEMASVGTFTTDTDGLPTSFTSGTGLATVVIEGNALIGPKKEDIYDNTLSSDAVNANFKQLGVNEGWVFGSSRGLSGDEFKHLSYTDTTNITIGGNAQVVSCVFGGGENGHVQTGTAITVGGSSVVGGIPLHGTSYTVSGGAYDGVTVSLSDADSEISEDEYGVGRRVFRGNVFGGGKGTDFVNNQYCYTAGRVYGNTHVTIDADAQVYNRVFGGGTIASVGTFTYKDNTHTITGVASGGHAYVTVNGGTIGSSNAAGRNNGDVYGGGRGIVGAPGSQVIDLAYVGTTHVTVNGGNILNSVYGGSANGHVQGDSNVEINQLSAQNPTIIGTPGLGRTHSNVYGGGGGTGRYLNDNNQEHLSITSGRVFGNSNVTITGGLVYHNVYGGGPIASVGTYILDGSAYPVASGTGTATVTVTGGTIGTTGDNNGMVYGSGRGEIAEPGHFVDSLSYVANAIVTIGTQGSNNGPRVKGSVYGSGENGHVFETTTVNIHSGIIGCTESEYNTFIADETTYADSIAVLPYRGNVYGAGCGTDTYATNMYNPKAGIVDGKTEINITGGFISHNVYGGGAMASVGVAGSPNITMPGSPIDTVGLATINITGGTIGFDGRDNGHIFGSGRGRAGQAFADLAFVNYTTVNINGTLEGTKVNGCVFGSGDNGHTHFDARVNVRGGTIGSSYTDVNNGNVFGGGRGSDFDNDGHISITAGKVGRDTKVNISGGLIKHAVYGGGNMSTVGSHDNDTDIANTGKAYVTVTGGVIGDNDSSHDNGHVFGAGRGVAGHDYATFNYVNNTFVTVGTVSGQNNALTINGSVFGGAENGHVKVNTEVTVNSGTIGTPLTVAEMDEHNPGESVGNQIIYRGNVYGGGRGIEHATSGELSETAGKVEGNTSVTVKGGKIYHDVFGGGSLANVGEASDNTTGHAYVTIEGGEIGMSPDDATTAGKPEGTGLNNGYVYGSGRGEAGTAYAHHAYVKDTHVTLKGGNVWGAVFGGGASGHVRQNTNVSIEGGYVGNNLSSLNQSNMYRGNVYGAGRGIDADNSHQVSPTAGWVQGNTNIDIKGGYVYHNVYGGGSLATVGEFDTDANGVVTAMTSGGTTTINITGGQIGIDGTMNGRVFGAGRGMAGQTVINQGTENEQTIDFSHLTYVKETYINVKPGADIKGSVYGSGDNGHTWTDTHVTMTGGNIGYQGGPADGNIFGGGRGQDTYGNGSMSPTAGMVFGDTYVDVQAGTLKANVYGGGDMSSVTGTTNVKVRGNSVVGVSSYADGGNVFGACRGGDNATNEFAKVKNTVVEILEGAKIQNHVYGGGEKGWVSENTDVTINLNADGTLKDVYGGGMGKVDLNAEADDDVALGTLVKLQNGTVLGSIYGGGRNGSVGFDAPEGTTVNSIVNINGGTVTENVYGGGKLGFTQGNTTVNMSGGLVKNHVFGGAEGLTEQVYVKGLRMVNMRGGTVDGNVYGGSFNADDAIDGFYASSAFSSYSGTQQVCVVNYSGGHTVHNVFGAGYRGRTYGSSYVFIGTDAIMNAPNHTATTGTDDPYNQAFYDNHEDLVIDWDVWAGADFGTYNTGSFGTATLTGRSDIYIDGNGYDTRSTESLGDGKFMILRKSVFGCGTLNDGGARGKRIMVRNYGTAVATASNTDPEPWASATRALHSIQYADSLIIDNSHIHLKGRGIVEEMVTTEEYTLHSIFDSVRIVNGSSIYIDKPVRGISNLISNIGSDLYGAAPHYTEVDYTDLPETGHNNRIRINKGTYLSVTKFDAVNNKYVYGALRGFFYLMTDGPYNAFAYARPKQSTEQGNIIVDEANHAYNSDGGFVSYQPELNIYTVEGGLVAAGNQMQMRYENHTPNQREYDDYFRIWRFKQTSAQSTFDVVLHAEAKPNAPGGFSNYKASLILPAQSGAGSYYRFKQIDGGSLPDINYGSELMTVTAGFQEYGTEAKWMYYYKTDNDHYGFTYDVTSPNAGLTTAQYFMTEYPTNAFGLTAIPAGGFSSGTNNKPWLICSDADTYLAEQQWGDMDPSVNPQIDFLLTHSNDINGNFNWDPLSLRMEQVGSDGNVTDDVTINVTIITSTTLEQTNKVKTYAMMTGSGDTQEIYKSRVVIPAYQLMNDNQHSNWTLTSVEWVPETGFDAYTFVEGQPAAATPALDPTSNYVGMTMYRAVNFDNVNGWWNPGEPTATDLGSNQSNSLNIALGETSAVKPMSFDFDLLYDGHHNVGLEGNAKMGTVKVTAHVTNYINGSGSDNGIDVEFEIEVFRRGKGKGFYIDGKHGDFIASGHYPDAAQPSLGGILHFVKDYEPVDSIYVVNTVTANAVNNLEWSTPFTYLKIFRYNGGHPLSKDKEPAKWNYTDYLTTYPENPAFMGPLVDVKTSMSISSAIIDGAYELKEMKGNYDQDESHVDEQQVAEHVIADAPLINILPGASLTIDGVSDTSRLINNYNGIGDGGAINIASEGLLQINRGTNIEHNYVTSDYQGGGVYMTGFANMLVSDNVRVINNKRMTGTKAEVANNVYLGSYNTVISVGTLETGDTYAALSPDAKIGVTKTDWDHRNYTPIVYSENVNHWRNLLENQNIVKDDEGRFDLYLYPEREANDDALRLSKLYWVETWVNMVTSNPVSGTYDPQDINTPEKLAWAISVANGYNGQDAAPGTNFKLTADIDMSQYFWSSIGDDSHAFTGIFDGNGHVVSGIRSPFTLENKGMFGSAQGATIQNLQASVDFYSSNAANGLDGEANNNLGGIVGKMDGGTVANCAVSGYLQGDNQTANIGGLVGLTTTNTTVHSSFAVDTLHALVNSTTLGGLVGTNNGDLYNAYSNVSIHGDSQSVTTVGGLAGVNNGTVENCYVNLQDPTQPDHFGWLVGTNSGYVNYSYGPHTVQDPYPYMYNGSAPSGHGQYGDCLDRKDLGYLYGDNQVTLASGQTNTYNSTEITYDNYRIDKFPGMLSTLNQWVKEKNNAGGSYTKWFRPTSGTVNYDFPVLGFPKDSVMAVTDDKAIFLRYSNDLDFLLDTTNKLNADASLFLYGTATQVANVPTDKVKVFVNEDAVLLQSATAANDFINTTVGITFDNSRGTSSQAQDYYGNNMEYDWHLLATPLKNAKIGATYSHKDGDNYTPDVTSTFQDSPVDIASLAGSYFPNGLTMGSNFTGTEVKWDFYNYFEPEYHWINLKRNRKNHFHYDGQDPQVNNRPYQLDKEDPYYRHYQINYWGYEGLADDQSDVATGDANCVFIPGKGYMMAISKDSYMSSTGSLNRGKVIMPITAEAPAEVAGSSSHKGSNLVGNPYQAYLDLDLISSSKANTGIDKFWVYDGDLNVYSPYTHTASKNPVAPSRYIHPHQGFFVVTDATTQLTFEPSMATTEQNEASYYRDQPSYPLVNLFVSDSQGNRDLCIVEVGRPELGGVPKINTMGNANFKMYARMDGQDFGLIFTPTKTNRVPVFFTTSDNDTYTINWSTHNGIFSRLRLIDNITGTDYDMLANDHYTFQGLATDFAARFYIEFSYTSVTENEQEANFAYFNGTDWVIEGEGTLELIDVLGRVLYSTNLVGRHNHVHLEGYAVGMYMLRMGDRVQKIVIE